MGQVFVTRQPLEKSPIADYASMAPEPLEISGEDFKARLKPFRGEIKGVLKRGDFMAGIGNAYADKILGTARLHPYRKRTSLTPDEVDRLYFIRLSALHPGSAGRPSVTMSMTTTPAFSPVWT